MFPPLFRSLFLPSLLLVGSPACHPDTATKCGDGTHEEGGRCFADRDADGDGYSVEAGDCDDADPFRHPGAVERCNDMDEDCDDLADNDAVDAAVWFTDADGDGLGDAGSSQLACDAPATYVANAGDCDDADGTVSPGAAERCGDGIDQDCDGADLTECSLGSATARYIGEADSDHAGYSVAAARDINADGYDDLLIGAWRNPAGSAYLILGGASVTSVGLASATAQYTGDAGDWAPIAVSGVGDVNADGYDDLLIGSSYADAAYLILGSAAPASLELTAASAQYTAESAGDGAGFHVAGAGDVNADGYDDLLIGALLHDRGPSDDVGAAYLVLGSASPGSLALASATAVYTGEAAGDSAGILSGAGDVDADGYDDLLIAAPWNDDGPGTGSGAAYLILGSAAPASLGLAAATAQYTGGPDDAFAGISVSGAGDINADGYADLLIGCSLNEDGPGTNAGAAYLILGSAAPASLRLAVAPAQYTGEAAEDHAGQTVSGAGDVNADGYDDLLIGAWGNDDGPGQDAGAAYLILGSAAPASVGLAAANAEYTGEAGSDYAGFSVSGGGDINADGYADLLIGAPSNDDGPGVESGSAYLILSHGF